MTETTTATTTAEESLKTRVKSFHDEWMEMSFANGKGFSEWWNKYFAKACPGIIRSSGNPLSSEDWSKMISSDDVSYVDRQRNRIVSIDSCLLFADGKAAITVLIADMVFNYKDIHNEDRAKISLTWTLKDDENWKIIHFQRATGQPIPPSDEKEN